MSTNEMTNKLREYKELCAMREEIEAEIANIEDNLKAELTAQGVEEIAVDVYKIRWKTVRISRLDSTAFKKTMPELAEKFTKTTVSRRFSVV